MRQPGSICMHIYIGRASVRNCAFRSPTRENFKTNKYATAVRRGPRDSYIHISIRRQAPPKKSFSLSSERGGSSSARRYSESVWSVGIINAGEGDRAATLCRYINYRIAPIETRPVEFRDFFPAYNPPSVSVVAFVSSGTACAAENHFRHGALSRVCCPTMLWRWVIFLAIWAMIFHLIKSSCVYTWSRVD